MTRPSLALNQGSQHREDRVMSELVSHHPEPQRVRRLLCCGITDDSDIRMFKDALARVDGNVDFVSLHSSDPGMVEEYRHRFSPDFIILAGAEQLTTGGAQSSLMAHIGKPEDFLGLSETIQRRMSLERPLTKKQLELLQYLRNGCTNKAIAEYMHVQPRTVKEWLKELYLLFFVCNRTELVARVAECGQELFVSEDEAQMAGNR